jgi:ATPase subunit of ABC transporter with duplicated ATPase domains
MQTEFDELDARKRLAPRKQAILAAIDKLALKSKLESCSEHLKSRPISDKSKELTDKAVTSALRDSLNREFEALGIHKLRAKLTNRVSGGRTYHKLVLDVPTTHKLSEILSEGELRVMAIASFLAELSLSEDSGGAIFDDPVSSLDHLRRAKVAERLVKESKQRQVIVFTHDTVFLAELRTHIEHEQLPAKYHHLQWASADFAGHCNEGLPWDHQGYKERIDRLEKDQRELQRTWTPVPTAELSSKMRITYSEFRATIERTVETVILCGTVRRFERYIPVEKLKGVIGFTLEEFNEVNRLFKKACDVTNAHDPASGGNIAVPDPGNLLKDITDLKTIIEMIGARSKQAKQLA